MRLGCTEELMPTFSMFINDFFKAARRCSSLLAWAPVAKQNMLKSNKGLRIREHPYWHPMYQPRPKPTPVKITIKASYLSEEMVLLWSPSRLFWNALMLLTKWVSRCHGAALAPKQWRTREKSILTEIQSSFTVTKWLFAKTGLKYSPIFIHTTAERALINWKFGCEQTRGMWSRGGCSAGAHARHLQKNGKQRGPRRMKGN